MGERGHDAHQLALPHPWEGSQLLSLDNSAAAEQHVRTARTGANLLRPRYSEDVWGWSVPRSHTVNVALFWSGPQAWPWTWEVGSDKREEMDSSRAWRWHWEWTCGPLVPDLVMKSGRRQSEEALRTPTPLPAQGRHCRSPRRARTLLSQGCCPSQTWTGLWPDLPSSLILHQLHAERPGPSLPQ